MWKLLIDKNLKKTDFLTLARISSVTLAKLSKNENVSTETLLRICEALNCKITDIVESVERDSIGDKNGND